MSDRSEVDLWTNSSNAARLHGIPRTTIEVAALRGVIRVRVVNGKRVFLLPDVERFAADRVAKRAGRVLQPVATNT